MSIVSARPGHAYVWIDAKTQAVVGYFTADEKPQWDDALEPALDVTGYRPQPRLGDVWDGRRFKTPVVLTVVDIEAQLRERVQDHLDKTARSLVYESIFTAVTYADEPEVPKFQNEGLALRKWRSQVWAKCYEILAAVLAGQRGIPTADQVIAELPAFVAP